MGYMRKNNQANPMYKYGYSDVDWSRVTNSVAQLVLQQYRDRLDSSLINFSDLDSKARYGLTGMIGLVTALLAYSKGDVSLPIWIMIFGFTLASLSYAASLWPRSKSGIGATTIGLKINEWAEGLIKPNAEIELMGIIISQYADNTLRNENTNRKKSQWLTFGLACAVGSVFLAVTALFILRVLH